MQKRLILIFCIVILLCVACTPSNATQDTPPATGSSSAVSTEPSGVVFTEPSEPLEESLNVPVGNADTIISKLLSEVNLTGKIQPFGQQVPPGTLPDISQIPPADQSIVGKSVTVNLGSNQTAGTFLFRIDPQSNKGVLAVVLRADQAFCIPLLVILETDLNSTTLWQALTSGADFGATVISATNISPEEGLYTSFDPSLNRLRPEEIVDLKTASITYPSSVQFVGRFGGETAPLLCKYDMDLSGTSECIHNIFDTFSRILSRFSISF